MSERWLWWTWGLLMVATLGASGLDRVWPTGAAEQVNLYDDAWELVTGDVTVAEGIASVAAGAEERAEWWHPVSPPGRGPWELQARARARVDGDPIRAVLRSADAVEPTVWIGTPRIRAGEWVTARRNVPAATASRPLQVGVVASGPGAAVDVAWLRLVEVRASWLFWGVVGMGTLSWGGLAGIGARRMLARNRRTAWWGLGGVALVVIGGLLPLVFLRAVGISAALQTASHGLGFAVIGGVLGRAGVGPAAVARLAALGASIEALQGLLMSRSASVEDVVFDAVGAVAGWSLGAALYARRSSER